MNDGHVSIETHKGHERFDGRRLPLSSEGPRGQS